MNRPSLYGAVAVATALAFAPAATAQMAPAPSWITYSNAEFHLAVETPTSANVKTSVNQRADGSQIRMLQGVSASGNVSTIFAVTDMTGVPGVVDGERVLKDAVDGAGAGRIVDKITTITVRGAPGRDMFAHADGRALHLRMFYTGGRLYMALQGAPVGTALPDFERFAASLKAT
jgi:hypothetical protein